jgi:hypothetical protein
MGLANPSGLDQALILRSLEKEKSQPKKDGT